MFYAPGFPLPLQTAQLVGQQLKEIGLDVEVRPVPLHIASAAYLSTLAAKGAQWDLALVLWAPGFADPYAYINLLLEGQLADGVSLTRFRSAEFKREMERAARLRQSAARSRAYGELDIRLARDAAPLAAISVLDEATLVSSRVGCITLRPVLDLATVCLDE